MWHPYGRDTLSISNTLIGWSSRWRLFFGGVFQGQSVKELSDLNMEHCPPLCIVTMSVKIVRIISV